MELFRLVAGVVGVVEPAPLALAPVPWLGEFLEQLPPMLLQDRVDKVRLRRLGDLQNMEAEGVLAVAPPPLPLLEVALGMGREGEHVGEG